MPTPGIIGRIIRRRQYRDDLTRAQRYRARMGYDQPDADRAARVRSLAASSRIVERSLRTREATTAPKCMPVS